MKRIVLAAIAIAAIVVVWLIGRGSLHINAVFFGCRMDYWLKYLLKVPFVYSAVYAAFPRFAGKFSNGNFAVLLLVTIALAFFSDFTGGDMIHLLYSLGAVLIGGFFMWVFVRAFGL